MMYTGVTANMAWLMGVERGGDACEDNADTVDPFIDRGRKFIFAAPPAPLLALEYTVGSCIKGGVAIDDTF